MHLQRNTLGATLITDMLHELRVELEFRIDPLLKHHFMRKKAAAHLNYWPNIEDPQTYNEKILWRKAFDRNPAFPIVQDKIRLREFLAEQLGQATADQVSTRLYATESDPRKIDFGALPDHYVVKANHGCGWNAFIRPEDPLEPALLNREMKRWMRRSFGKDLHEWAYVPIKRQVMVEEMLLFDSGQMANDIKFAVFDGTCEFIVYCDDRFGDHCWHHLTRGWDRLFSTPIEASAKPVPAKPQGFDEMLRIAEDVTKGFDFFRVDFLFTDSRFVLNEITLYDAAGYDPLDPPIWDKRFGEFWTLPV